MTTQTTLPLTANAIIADCIMAATMRVKHGGNHFIQPQHEEWMRAYNDELRAAITRLMGEGE